MTILDIFGGIPGYGGCLYSHRLSESSHRGISTSSFRN